MNIKLAVAFFATFLAITSCGKAGKTDDDVNPANCRIEYTTTDGQLISFDNLFFPQVVSHEYSDGRGLIVFEDEVTTIGNDAFVGASNLKTITLPSSLSFVEEYAFAGTTSLEAFYGGLALNSRCLVTQKHLLVAFAEAGITEFSIPESVEAIGNRVFEGVKNLKKITFPTTLKQIGQASFRRCDALEEIHFKTNNPPLIGNEAFLFLADESKHLTVKVYVPRGSKSLYDEVLRDFIYTVIEE